MVPTQKTPSTTFLVSARDTSMTKPKSRRTADNRHRSHRPALRFAPDVQIGLEALQRQFAMNYEHTAYPKELCRQVAVKSARYGQPQLPKFGFDKVAFDQPKQLGVVRFSKTTRNSKMGLAQCRTCKSCAITILVLAPSSTSRSISEH